MKLKKVWSSIKKGIKDNLIEGAEVVIDNSIGSIMFIAEGDRIAPYFRPNFKFISTANKLWRVKNERYRKIDRTISIGDLQAWDNEEHGEFSIVEDRCGYDDPMQEERCEEDDEEGNS